MAVKITRKRKNGSKRKTGKVMNGGVVRDPRLHYMRMRSRRVSNSDALGPHLKSGLGALLANPGGTFPRIRSPSVKSLIYKFSEIEKKTTMRRAPIITGAVNSVRNLAYKFGNPLSNVGLSTPVHASVASRYKLDNLARMTTGKTVYVPRANRESSA